METETGHIIGSYETELTVVIPVYNEVENIEPLFMELLNVMKRLGKNFEILYIDDASSDGSVSVLEDLSRRYSELRMVRHRINCGQSAAIATGFANARSDIIVTMDGDQQNDPADIPSLLDALKGADAVCGVRMKREDNWIRRISSKIANGFRNWITGDTIADAGCACRAMKRYALKELPAFNGMHRFLPTLLRLKGYTVTEIPVNHRPRTRGTSKYGIGNRMFRGIIDCFAIRWLRMRCFPGDRTIGDAGKNS